MHYPQQSDRASDPNVQLPFKFVGGFGINVSLPIHFCYYKVIYAR